MQRDHRDQRTVQGLTTDLEKNTFHSLPNNDNYRMGLGMSDAENLGLPNRICESQ
jgi:hypothetical protein